MVLQSARETEKGNTQMEGSPLLQADTLAHGLIRRIYKRREKKIWSLLESPCHVVLVRVLQRNGTNRIFFFVESHKEIYYKKLAHIIMEADKSLGLELANWRPRRAKGLVPG